MGSPHWPLFGLRVRTPRLELRYPDDEIVHALSEVAAAGIHEPDTMPFSVPWTRQDPAVFGREYVRHFWRSRAETTPQAWSIHLAVFLDGEVVGVQDVFSRSHFAVTRAFETGSWLGRRFQGQGIGTEMRAAALHLAFAGLGAEVAETGCWEDNPASERVTRTLGYADNGWHVGDREGQAVRMKRFVMERRHWETIRRDDIAIDGVEPCLDLLGLG